MRLLTRDDFNNLSDNELFSKACAELYGSENGYEYQLSRYKSLYDIHSKVYDKAMMFSSPGRIEVCGNHTDHNNGIVLCASISVDTIACVTPTNDHYITVASVGYPPVNIDLNKLSPNKDEYGSSEALVRGVCAYFKQNGYNIGGFYATTTSDVFKGAGVSSSACFEVLVCEILNVLYNEGKIDALTKAYASHHAESVFFGKPCGLMDQSAIALGGVSYIDFKDTSAPEVESIPWKFNDVDIVLVNCGGDHCGLTDQYAAIRKEMEEVASLLGAKVLRETSMEVLLGAVESLQTKTSGRAILRAIHYFNENNRVIKCADAIRGNQLEGFYDMINGSGESSYMLLQNCYPEGDTMQRIPLALALARIAADNKGALRVHGGGFAGTIIAYVPSNTSSKVISALTGAFGSENIFKIGIRNSGACLVEL